MLIDTHAHLFWESFQEDFDQVIERALAAGVKTIINIGVDPESNRKVIKLKSDKIQFFASLGIHPHEFLRFAQDKLPLDVSIHQEMEGVEKLYKESISNPACSPVVAIGECGLDYLFEQNPGGIPSDIPTAQVKILQQKLFSTQVELAKKLDLPLIVHTRDTRSFDLSETNPEKAGSTAWEDVFKFISGVNGVFHCYSAPIKLLPQVLKTNFYISFTATLTYPKNESLREAAKQIPLERILLETDCPFLPPQNQRGKRNEPSFILETAKVLAEIKGLSLEETAKQTTKNAHLLFKLG